MNCGAWEFRIMHRVILLIAVLQSTNHEVCMRAKLLQIDQNITLLVVLGLQRSCAGGEGEGVDRANATYASHTSVGAPSNCIIGVVKCHNPKFKRGNLYAITVCVLDTILW